MFLSRAPGLCFLVHFAGSIRAPFVCRHQLFDSGSRREILHSFQLQRTASAGCADQHFQSTVQGDLLAPVKRRGPEPTSATNDGADAGPFAPSEDAAQQPLRLLHDWQESVPIYPVDRKPRKTRKCLSSLANHIGPESALVRSEPIPNRAVRLMQDGERKHKYQPSPQE